MEKKKKIMSAECIYKFVEQPKAKKSKSAIHRSKYDPKPLIGSTFCMQGTTVVDGKGFHSLKQNHVVTSSFGVVEAQPPDPKEFLRKGTRQCRDGARISLVEHHRNKEAHKPVVPTRTDKPVQGLTTAKNYVNCNAVEIINSSPKKRNQAEVPYTSREDYGKVPAYLEAVKTKIQHEKELVEKYVAEQYGSVDDNCQEEEIMAEEERMELITKLKQRWGELNSEYQKYCHKVILDTPGEIKRKASQEAELMQLESYIEQLSSAGPILIRK